ncbi:MAG TPA: type II toxin-antitoxin system PemK/MazF family toxin [Bacteroidia bacterium]|jgi:mRNA interferase MazF|nr:type II toxin-antitoxin system PemK/MazF family toxin [Bacteroidia bacterium]HQF28252.1 type II toxin-antitoxin system PemK/MazF family toxin [Bacteroidia bacterium]HQK98997.1 type II toxin-antitoxin system PemK/MazF family toxin [Bacteroidia bacterium]
MRIKKFDIWLADLNPRMGTEPGKIRPVVIVQTDLLNGDHPSTIICPITSKILPEAEILRIHLPKATIKEPCDIIVDQIRAIDNKRFIKKVGGLSLSQSLKLTRSIKIVLDLE